MEDILFPLLVCWKTSLFCYSSPVWGVFFFCSSFYFYHPVMSYCKKKNQHCLFKALWEKSQWPMGICTYKLVCHSSGLCSLAPWGVWPNMIYFLKWPLTVIQSPTWLWICQWHQLQIGSHFQFGVPLWALKEPRSSWAAWCSLVDKFKCDGRPALKLFCSIEGWAGIERRKAKSGQKCWIKSCRWWGSTPPRGFTSTVGTAQPRCSSVWFCIRAKTSSVLLGCFSTHFSGV